MENKNTTTNKTDLSLSMMKANLYAFVIVAPVIILLLVLYVQIWGYAGFLYAVGKLSERPIYTILNSTIAIIAILVGGVAHELIHAASWVIFGHIPSSAVKFRFHLKTLTPYAHCKEPIRVQAYRIAAAMPGLILGLLPSAIGIITANICVFLFGLAFVLTAGGDMLVLWLVRTVDANKLIEDHPTRVGGCVVEPQTKHGQAA